MNVEEYAVAIVATSAETLRGCAVNPPAHFSYADEDAGYQLAVDMAQAIGAHPAAFIAWYREVTA